MALNKSETIGYTLGLLFVLFMGYMIGVYMHHDSKINVSCIADAVEDDLKRAEEQGYIYNGVVSIKNTLGASIGWYWRYTFISRSLMEKNIRDVLKDCTSKDVVITLTEEQINEFEKKMDEFLEYNKTFSTS